MSTDKWEADTAHKVETELGTAKTQGKGWQPQHPFAGCRALLDLQSRLTFTHPTESGKCRVRLGATCRCVGQSVKEEIAEFPSEAEKFQGKRISQGRTTQKNGGGDGRRVLLTYKCRQALRHPSRHGIGTHQQKFISRFNHIEQRAKAYGQNAPGNDACRNGCIVG